MQQQSLFRDNVFWNCSEVMLLQLLKNVTVFSAVTSDDHNLTDHGHPVLINCNFPLHVETSSDSLNLLMTLWFLGRKILKVFPNLHLETYHHAILNIVLH